MSTGVLAKYFTDFGSIRNWHGGGPWARTARQDDPVPLYTTRSDLWQFLFMGTNRARLARPARKRFLSALWKHVEKFTPEEREAMIQKGAAILSAASRPVKRVLRAKLPRQVSTR